MFKPEKNPAVQLSFRPGPLQRFLRLCLWILSFIFLLSFVFWPVLRTLSLVYQENQGDLPLIWQKLWSSHNVEALRNSILLGLLTVVVCGATGSFLAFYTLMIQPRKAKVLHSFLFLPFVLPGVVSVLAFIQIYADTGVINQTLKALFHLDEAPFQFTGLPAILLIHAATQYVIFYLQLRLALQNVDHSQIEAARQLGASSWSVFTTVFWPECRQAVLMSSLLTFVAGISAYSAPYLVGGRFTVLSARIAASKLNNDMGGARLQVLLLFGLAAILMLFSERFSRQQHFDRDSRGVRRGRFVVQNRKLRFLLHLIAVLLILMIFIPLLAVIYFSFGPTKEWMTQIVPTTLTLENYVQLFGARRALRPLRNSLQMSLLAALTACVFSLIFLLISDRRRDAASNFGRFGFTLPAAIPASTLGIMLISAFNQPFLLLGNQILVGTFWIMPLAYAITALPIAFRTVQGSLERFPLDYAHAAANLGASSWKVLWQIRLPLARPAIISAFLYVFMRALGEYNISSLLYNVKTEPISIRMISAMHDYNMGLSMAYASVILIMSLLISFIVSSLEKRRSQLNRE